MKKATMKKSKSSATEEKGGDSPSRLIDGRIKELSDWRGETLARIRALIKQAEPEVVEEWKWRGVPVWSHGGIICTGETYKAVVKMTFAKGASLEDPSGLFNSSLEGNTRRAIDIHEGDKIDEKGIEGAHSRRRGPEHLLGRQAAEDETIDDRELRPLLTAFTPAPRARAMRACTRRPSGSRTACRRSGSPGDTGSQARWRWRRTQLQRRGPILARRSGARAPHR
jgi:hypothetical protein